MRQNSQGAGMRDQEQECATLRAGSASRSGLHTHADGLPFADRCQATVWDAFSTKGMDLLNLESERLPHPDLDLPAGLDGRLDFPVTCNCQHRFKKHSMFIVFRQDAFYVACLIEQDVHDDQISKFGIDSLPGHDWHRRAQQANFFVRGIS